MSAEHGTYRPFTCGRCKALIRIWWLSPYTFVFLAACGEYVTVQEITA